MHLMEKQDLLKVIEDYIISEPAKKWRPGKDHVHYAGPFFNQDEILRSISTLLDGWLVLGAEAHKAEKKLASMFQKKYALLTNSGSSSNLLMMSALKSKRLTNFPAGTKVLTPIAGFPTTINPIFQCGFTPVFVDIEIDGLNLDLKSVQEALEKDPDIQIITFAHVLGNPPDIDKLMSLVREHDLILLEDCCDALGSTFDGNPLGSFGLMSSCSFYPAHHITCGEGGLITCNNEQVEKVIRSIRDWGRGCFCIGKQNITECGACGTRFSEWLPSIPGEVFDHKYVYEEVGYNLKPIEVQASMLLAQLDKFDEISRLRKRNYQLLFDIFSPYEEYFHLPRPQLKADVNWFAFPLTIRENSPFKRSDMCQYLESKKIQTRPYFAGNILVQPAYSHLIGDLQLKDFPMANFITTNTFFLGTSPVITEEQISYIKEMVDSFMRNYHE
jgi:CDP-6-deoxy-D-xylo-4-hexulose-3-dehydrase